MMKTRWSKIIGVAFALCLIAGATPASAACLTPAGDEGDQVYNSTHDVMQFCNGTDWYAMASDGDTVAGLTCTDTQVVAWDNSGTAWVCADAAPTDTLGALSCTDGQIASWDNGGTAWVCDDDNVGDDLGDHTATTDIDSASNGVVNLNNVIFVGIAGDPPVALAGAGLSSGSGGGGGCAVLSVGSLGDIDGESTSTQYESLIGQVSTVGCTASISVSGSGSPEYRVCSNSDCSTVVSTWNTSAGSVDDGEYVQMRATTGGTEGVSADAYLAVGSNVTTVSVEAIDYKHVFITAGTYDGNIGGLAAADTICAADATTYGLSGTYEAWTAQTTGNDPESTFTQSTTPYRNAAAPNAIIADDWADLVDGTIQNVITKVDGTASPTYVFTNVNQAGARVGGTSDCGNFASTAGTNMRVGLTNSTTATWSTSSNISCATQVGFYCFEQ